MKIETEDLTFRPLQDSDKAFVFNSWLKSYRNSSFAKSMINEVYFTFHAKLIEQALVSSQVIVAASTVDQTQVYGWIVFRQLDEDTIVHYVYVKFPYRKFGLGEQLLRFASPDAEKYTIITHEPRNFELLSKKFNLVYNPYLIGV